MTPFETRPLTPQSSAGVGRGKPGRSRRSPFNTSSNGQQPIRARCSSKKTAKSPILSPRGLPTVRNITECRCILSTRVSATSSAHTASDLNLAQGWPRMSSPRTSSMQSPTCTVGRTSRRHRASRGVCDLSFKRLTRPGERFRTCSHCWITETPRRAMRLFSSLNRARREIFLRS